MQEWNAFLFLVPTDGDYGDYGDYGDDGDATERRNGDGYGHGIVS